MQGGATQAMPVCIVEERQHSRCPRAAGTRKGTGPKGQPLADCGRSLRRSSSTMNIDIASSCWAISMPFRRLPDGPVRTLTSSRKTQARDPLYFHHGLLGL